MRLVLALAFFVNGFIWIGCGMAFRKKLMAALPDKDIATWAAISPALDYLRARPTIRTRGLDALAAVELVGLPLQLVLFYLLFGHVGSEKPDSTSTAPPFSARSETIAYLTEFVSLVLAIGLQWKVYSAIRHASPGATIVVPVYAPFGALISMRRFGPVLSVGTKAMAIASGLAWAAAAVAFVAIRSQSVFSQ